MTDPQSQAEVDRADHARLRRYRRALELAVQDLRIIEGFLARARGGELSEHAWRSLHRQADAARYRVEQTLLVDE